MSDITEIQNLVRKRADLKKEIAKIIIENIGEDCLLKIKNDPHILDSINLTDKQKHVINDDTSNNFF